MILSLPHIDAANVTWLDVDEISRSTRSQMGPINATAIPEGSAITTARRVYRN